MFDWLSQILGFFELIWSLVVNFFETIGQLISLLITYHGMVVYLPLVVPAVLGASVTIIAAVSIVKLLAGR